MCFIFSTGSLWSYGIDRCFAFAAAAGFDGVEVMVDQRYDTRQADYVRGLVERTGQPVIAVHTPFSPTFPGWPPFDDEPGRIRASVRLAEALGAPVVVHHLPERGNYTVLSISGKRMLVPRPGDGRNTRYRHWLETEYSRVQAGTDVLLCIENMPARRFFGRRYDPCVWNTPAEMLRFPHLTLDTTHLGTWGIDPIDVYDEFGGRVRHVHLSNYDGREHRRPEAGRLHLDALLARMARDGYTGAIALELHPDALDAGKDDDHVVALLAESLRQCRAWATPPETAPLTGSLPDIIQPD